MHNCLLEGGYNHFTLFRIHRSVQKGSLTEAIDVPDEDVADIVEALQYFGFNLDNKVWLLQPGKSLQSERNLLFGLNKSVVCSYIKAVYKTIYAFEVI